MTKIEDLQLNNKRLVDHNAELSFQVCFGFKRLNHFNFFGENESYMLFEAPSYAFFKILIILSDLSQKRLVGTGVYIIRNFSPVVK